MKMFSVKSEIDIEEKGREYGVAHIPARFTPTAPVHGRRHASSTQIVGNIKSLDYLEVRACVLVHVCHEPSV